MTTSGTTAWSLTAQQIIDASLRENGIIAIGESPTTDESNECLLRLNGILKSWTGGDYLVSSADVTVPADSASGTLAVEVHEILSARLEVSSTYERQLTQWERSEYMRLPNKAQSGEPVAFHADNQRDAVTLYVWPVPTAERTLKVEYVRVPETITALTQTVDWPRQYNEALFTTLAVRCAGIFGRQPSPELADRAGYLRRMMEDEQRPEAYIMEVM